MWVSLVFLMVAGARAALGQSASAYCSTNTLPSTTAGMQLTKEPIPFEYGFEDKFKSIFCCGKGYRSIEWFKDNVAYPWSAGVSNLIQYPEAANQTLYTQRASRSDTGNYTCRISNETHSEQHTIYLEVLEKPPDAPKTMFISKDQGIEEGGAVRLYCEALVGRSYLADARSDLRWKKLWSNNSEGDLLPSQQEVKTKRDDIEDIIGSYLMIDSVSAADYGTYVCIVKSNEVISKSYVTVHYKYLSDLAVQHFLNHHQIPWGALLFGFIGAFVLIASIVVIHKRCTLKLLLAARLAHARANATEERARVLEKEFDVLVCWTPIDGELVRGVLLPTLTQKYNYRVLPMQIETMPDTWYNSLLPEMHRCRSIVCVLSPTQHSASQLTTALKQLWSLQVPPIIILLQDVPKLKREPKDAKGESLVEMLRRSRLLPWRHVHERDFWTALRLALPLPPVARNNRELKVHVAVDETTKNIRSSSLTALV